MLHGRFIEVPAVQVDDKLIPLWECDVWFQYNSPWRIDYQGKALDARKVVEALYDLETKKVTLNVRIVYPETAKYSIGETVGVDVGGHTIRVLEIADVQDGREELRIMRGSELRGWKGLFREDKDGLTPIKGDELEPDKKYTYKAISRKYVFTDGTTAEWDHQVFRLEGNK